MSLRREKLQELFKEEASAILQRRLRDPRIGFVSVTEVELSADLRHAKIFVSVLGDEEAKRRTMEALDRAAGFVRSELGRRGTRVVALLREVTQKEPPAQAAPDRDADDEPTAPESDDDQPSRPDRGSAP